MLNVLLSFVTNFVLSLFDVVQLSKQNKTKNRKNFSNNAKKSTERQTKNIKEPFASFRLLRKS